ncbi:hypothetical protein [Nisaea sp.]|uniref:hypothetical protein n=1 Tax=Nisaea sp. TaxID=2024842 RepID=UPI003267AF53
MDGFKYFELIRLSDDLVYQFDFQEKSDGVFGYKRRDQDLWITHQVDLGWVAFDQESNAILGKPWETLPGDQSLSHPPEGIWVSRKGSKSYVYELRYLKSK